MYTDGIIEAANRMKEMFGLKRLIDQVEKCAAEKPAVILDDIMQAVKDCIHPEPQVDDMTLLILKVQ